MINVLILFMPPVATLDIVCATPVLLKLPRSSGLSTLVVRVKLPASLDADTFCYTLLVLEIGRLKLFWKRCFTS